MQKSDVTDYENTIKNLINEFALSNGMKFIEKICLLVKTHVLHIQLFNSRETMNNSYHAFHKFEITLIFTRIFPDADQFYQKLFHGVFQKIANM
jgi:hypothetical protein